MNLVVQEPDILILFYSMYGHIYQMAQEAEKAVKEIGGNPKLMRIK